MTRPACLQLLADVILVAHLTFVAFVILGLLMVLVGGARGWSWTRNPWFRAAHLAAIGLVALQAWLGMICPLTTLEMLLRERAGDATYPGAFVAHWLQQLLYLDAPPWAFACGYTAFALAVIGVWRKFRPRSFRDHAPPRR
jgi:hypothetical protein